MRKDMFYTLGILALMTIFGMAVLYSISLLFS